MEHVYMLWVAVAVVGNKWAGGPPNCFFLEFIVNLYDM